MTQIITARNVNSALHDGLWYLKVAGAPETTRVGKVIVAPGPVIVEYQKPCERVLFSAARDANPYFHLFEALFFLAGRNDLAFLLQFNSRFHEFSDDGITLHGSYGYRWRHWKGERIQDQLMVLINHLKNNPESRRAVLTIWNPELDLDAEVRDAPCNTQCFFDCRGGVLNMTVCNRSNDLLWGLAGANAVHFSFLIEYLAAHIGIPVGVYRQFSNNFHAYTDMPGYPSIDPAVIGEDDKYASGEVTPFLLIQDPIQFDLELSRFMSDPLGDTAYEELFFEKVAYPMYASWSDRKGKHNNGRLAAEAIGASDWRLACRSWIDRREKAKTV